jgi:hypothetical protein
MNLWQRIHREGEGEKARLHVSLFKRIEETQIHDRFKGEFQFLCINTFVTRSNQLLLLTRINSNECFQFLKASL